MRAKIAAGDRATYRNAARKIFRDARTTLGITQAQLGVLLDLSQGEVSRIEAGAVEPPVWFIMYLLHTTAGLSTSITANADQLRRTLRQQVDLIDAPAIAAILTLIRRHIVVDSESR